MSEDKPVYVAAVFTRTGDLDSEGLAPYLDKLEQRCICLLDQHVDTSLLPDTSKFLEHYDIGKLPRDVSDAFFTLCIIFRTREVLHRVTGQPLTDEDAYELFTLGAAIESAQIGSETNAYAKTRQGGRKGGSSEKRKNRTRRRNEQMKEEASDFMDIGKSYGDAVYYCWRSGMSAIGRKRTLISLEYWSYQRPLWRKADTGLQGRIGGAERKIVISIHKAVLVLWLWCRR